MAQTKTPAPRRAGNTTTAKEAKALELAQAALHVLKNDPEAIRIFIRVVAVLGARMLR